MDLSYGKVAVRYFYRFYVLKTLIKQNAFDIINRTKQNLSIGVKRDVDKREELYESCQHEKIL